MAQSKVYHIDNGYPPERMLDEVIKMFEENKVKAMTIIILDDKQEVHSYWYPGGNFMTLLGALHSLSFDMLSAAERV